MAKKKFFLVTLFLVIAGAIFADDLADLLQDLAVQTACLGMYSSAETGVLVTSRYDDPPDWYDPPMMANRFAAMSGNMTRIATFYGVCFDYAQFAWDDIKKYQTAYNAAGMKGQQWYIAAANDGDPNTIILYDPVSKEKATTISNGVYLKENSRHKVYTHDGASGHAWLWVQHNNGTWYWIDPTWTDNTGYVWWGMVENGREMQYYPDPAYCVASNYPQPPRPNETPATRPNETPSERTTRSSDPTYPASPDADAGLTSLSYSISYLKPFDSGSDDWGISLSIENPFLNTFGLFSFSLDHLTNPGGLNQSWIENGVYNTIIYTEDSLIFGTAFGYPLFGIFVLYAGGGLGFTWHEETSSGSSLHPNSDYSYNDTPAVFSIELAWKVNAGLWLNLTDLFSFKFDVSYGTIIGLSFGVGVGIIM
jgi:hypothetical protein